MTEELQLPVGRVPGDWKVLSLKEVTSKIGSGSTPRGGASVYVEVGASFIRSQNVLDHGFSSDGLVRINEEAAYSLRGVEVRNGDVLINITGDSILRTCIVPDEVLPARVSQHVAILRSNGLIEPQVLQKWLSLEVMKDFMLGHSSGGTRKAVTKGDLERFPVPVPPLAEQREIAGVLGAIDDKIEANRRIMKQMELLLLAHSNSLSTLPRVALHEVSKSYRRPVNPLVLGDEWVDHFSLPAFDLSAMPERCQASSIMSGKFGIETTSVLISRLNPGTPRVWCAHVREVPAMCSSEFLVLEPLKKSSVGALWLAAVHPSLGEQMVQRATGTSFSHQRIKSDDALSVEVPDIRMIDDQVRTECDELIEMVGKRRSENEHLSRLRDVLLPELLSGRLRVKDAESMMENV